MFVMKRFLTAMLTIAALALIAEGVADAQVQPMNQPLPSPSFNVPPPPPPPPPKIEVPAIPKMDAPPKQPRVNVNPRGSFSDRVTNCLHDGAAAGLGPSERSEYSRACANR
ncbi:MAG: hypothetical protein A4S14_08190 [Proteobacteria bacterium SG_bin9]|nr:MAG: hypothetical protein A4S14_08190 [Proteobacteria bacterium SG_bin9]